MRPAPHEHAIEVLLYWGGQGGAAACVLAVGYVPSGGCFTLGEAEGCDALVPYEQIGTTRAVVAAWEGAPFVHPPRRALVWVDGQPAPAEPTLLVAGAVLDMSFGAFGLRARLVPRDRPSFRARVADAALQASLVASLIGHGVACGLLSLLLRGADGAGLDGEALATRQRLLLASAQHEDEPIVRVLPRRSELAPRGHAAAEPLVASRASLPSEAIAPPPAAPLSAPVSTSTTPSPGPGDVEGFGVIELVKGLAADPAEAKPWTDALASLDEDDARKQAMFGDGPIASIGGMSLSGIGSGGGGKVGFVGDEHLPIPSADAIQAQIAMMDPGGFGHVKDTRGTLPPRGPRVKFVSDLPSERVPDVVIANVVRASGGRFRVCHGLGLRRNPALAGRVEVAFVIGENGQVTQARDAGGELDDEVVRRCIVKTFFGLTFPPPPQGGTQNVKFPIVLRAPDDG